MSGTFWKLWAGTALLGCLIAAPARADRDEAVYPVGGDPDVEIELVQGSIEINGWDRDELRVRARGNDIDALEIEAEDDWVSIRPRGGGGWLAFGGSVDIRVDVPRNARVRARAINGRIRAEDVEGRLSLQTVNGQIDVRGTPEEAFLETVSSSIEFRGEGERNDARVDLRTMSGSIDVREVGDEITASTMSGSIRVRDARLRRAEMTSMSGSIDVDAEIENDARILARTHAGSITLTVPEDTVARFDASTRSGRIKNELGPEARQRRGSHRLDFETGDGGDSRITLENARGSIRIRARN